MVLARSVAKRSLGDPPLEGINTIKRTRVHAQRKFAQGSALSPVNSNKDIIKFNGAGLQSEISSSKQSSSSNEIAEILPAKRPNTEDFLTFLCFRNTSILPARLDFFSSASTSADSKESGISKKYLNSSEDGVNLETILQSAISTSSDQNLRKIGKNKRQLASALKALKQQCQSKKISGKTKVNISKLAQKVRVKHLQASVATRNRRLTKWSLRNDITSKKSQPDSVKRTTALKKDNLRNRNAPQENKSSETSKSSPVPSKVVNQKLGMAKISHKSKLKRSVLSLKRGLRSGGSSHLVSQESTLKAKRAQVIRNRKARLGAKKEEAPVKDSPKLKVKSVGSDFSSDDDQPLIKKSRKKETLPNQGKSTRATALNTASKKSVPTRPSRRTKEAATLLMEMLGKDILGASSKSQKDGKKGQENSSDKSLPELPSTKKTEPREKVTKENNGKQGPPKKAVSLTEGLRAQKIINNRILKSKLRQGAKMNQKIVAMNRLKRSKFLQRKTRSHSAQQKNVSKDKINQQMKTRSCLGSASTSVSAKQESEKPVETTAESSRVSKVSMRQIRQMKAQPSSQKSPLVQENSCVKAVLKSKREQSKEKVASEISSKVADRVSEKTKSALPAEENSDSSKAKEENVKNELKFSARSTRRNSVQNISPPPQIQKNRNSKSTDLSSTSPLLQDAVKAAQCDALKPNDSKPSKKNGKPLHLTKTRSISKASSVFKKHAPESSNCDASSSQNSSKSNDVKKRALSKQRSKRLVKESTLIRSAEKRLLSSSDEESSTKLSILKKLATEKREAEAKASINKVSSEKKNESVARAKKCKKSSDKDEDKSADSNNLGELKTARLKAENNLVDEETKKSLNASSSSEPKMVPVKAENKIANKELKKSSNAGSLSQLKTVPIKAENNSTDKERNKLFTAGSSSQMKPVSEDWRLENSSTDKESKKSVNSNNSSELKMVPGKAENSSTDIDSKKSFNAASSSESKAVPVKAENSATYKGTKKSFNASSFSESRTLPAKVESNAAGKETKKSFNDSLCESKMLPVKAEISAIDEGTKNSLSANSSSELKTVPIKAESSAIDKRTKKSLNASSSSEFKTVLVKTESSVSDKGLKKSLNASSSGELKKVSVRAESSAIDKGSKKLLNASSSCELKTVPVKAENSATDKVSKRSLNASSSSELKTVPVRAESSAIDKGTKKSLNASSSSELKTVPVKVTSSATDKGTKSSLNASSSSVFKMVPVKAENSATDERSKKSMNSSPESIIALLKTENNLTKKEGNEVESATKNESKSSTKRNCAKKAKDVEKVFCDDEENRVESINLSALKTNFSKKSNESRSSDEKNILKKELSASSEEEKFSKLSKPEKNESNKNDAANVLVLSKNSAKKSLLPTNPVKETPSKKKLNSVADSKVARTSERENLKNLKNESINIPICNKIDTKNKSLPLKEEKQNRSNPIISDFPEKSNKSLPDSTITMSSNVVVKKGFKLSSESKNENFSDENSIKKCTVIPGSSQSLNATEVTLSQIKDGINCGNFDKLNVLNQAVEDEKCDASSEENDKASVDFKEKLTYEAAGVKCDRLADKQRKNSSNNSFKNLKEIDLRKDFILNENSSIKDKNIEKDIIVSAEADTLPQNSSSSHENLMEKCLSGLTSNSSGTSKKTQSVSKREAKKSNSANEKVNLREGSTILFKSVEHKINTNQSRGKHNLEKNELKLNIFSNDTIFVNDVNKINVTKSAKFIESSLSETAELKLSSQAQLSLSPSRESKNAKANSKFELNKQDTNLCSNLSKAVVKTLPVSLQDSEKVSTQKIIEPSQEDLVAASESLIKLSMSQVVPFKTEIFGSISRTNNYELDKFSCFQTNDMFNRGNNLKVEPYIASKSVKVESSCASSDEDEKLIKFLKKEDNVGRSNNQKRTFATKNAQKVIDTSSVNSKCSTVKDSVSIKNELSAPFGESKLKCQKNVSCDDYRIESPSSFCSQSKKIKPSVSDLNERKNSFYQSGRDSNLLEASGSKASMHEAKLVKSDNQSVKEAEKNEELRRYSLPKLNSLTMKKDENVSTESEKRLCSRIVAKDIKGASNLKDNDASSLTKFASQPKKVDNIEMEASKSDDKVKKIGSKKCENEKNSPAKVLNFKVKLNESIKEGKPLDELRKLDSVEKRSRSSNIIFDNRVESSSKSNGAAKLSYQIMEKNMQHAYGKFDVSGKNICELQSEIKNNLKSGAKGDPGAEDEDKKIRQESTEMSDLQNSSTDDESTESVDGKKRKINSLNSVASAALQRRSNRIRQPSIPVQRKNSLSPSPSSQRVLRARKLTSFCEVDSSSEDEEDLNYLLASEKYFAETDSQDESNVSSRNRRDEEKTASKESISNEKKNEEKRIVLSKRNNVCSQSKSVPKIVKKDNEIEAEKSSSQNASASKNVLNDLSNEEGAPLLKITNKSQIVDSVKNKFFEMNASKDKNINSNKSQTVTSDLKRKNISIEATKTEKPILPNPALNEMTINFRLNDSKNCKNEKLSRSNAIPLETSGSLETQSKNINSNKEEAINKRVKAARNLLQNEARALPEQFPKEFLDTKCEASGKNLKPISNSNDSKIINTQITNVLFTRSIEPRTSGGDDFSKSESKQKINSATSGKDYDYAQGSRANLCNQTKDINMYPSNPSQASGTKSTREANIFESSSPSKFKNEVSEKKNVFVPNQASNKTVVNKVSNVNLGMVPNTSRTYFNRHLAANFPRSGSSKEGLSASRNKNLFVESTKEKQDLQIGKLLKNEINSSLNEDVRKSNDHSAAVPEFSPTNNPAAESSKFPPPSTKNTIQDSSSVFNDNCMPFNVSKKFSLSDSMSLNSNLTPEKSNISKDTASASPTNLNASWKNAFKNIKLPKQVPSVPKTPMDRNAWIKKHSAPLKLNKPAEPIPTKAAEPFIMKNKSTDVPSSVTSQIKSFTTDHETSVDCKAKCSKSPSGSSKDLSSMSSQPVGSTPKKIENTKQSVYKLNLGEKSTESTPTVPMSQVAPFAKTSDNPTLNQSKLAMKDTANIEKGKESNILGKHTNLPSCVEQTIKFLTPKQVLPPMKKSGSEVPQTLSKTDEPIHGTNASTLSVSSKQFKESTCFDEAINKMKNILNADPSSTNKVNTVPLNVEKSTNNEVVAVNPIDDVKTSTKPAESVEEHQKSPSNCKSSLKSNGESQSAVESSKITKKVSAPDLESSIYNQFTSKKSISKVVNEDLSSSNLEKTEEINSTAPLPFDVSSPAINMGAEFFEEYQQQKPSYSSHPTLKKYSQSLSTPTRKSIDGELDWSLSDSLETETAAVEDTPEKTTKKVIFQQRRSSSSKDNESKKAVAFSPEHESSVYAFEPDLPPTNAPFRRNKNKLIQDSTSNVVTCPSTASSNNSIAVQVNLETETVIECSTRTDADEGEEGKGQLFYIPIQGSAAAPSPQLQVVALKLDTGGPDQRVIMRAKLVTNPTPNYSKKTAAVATNTVSSMAPLQAVVPEKRKVRPLGASSVDSSAPVGTVQPTSRTALRDNSPLPPSPKNVDISTSSADSCAPSTSSVNKSKSFKRGKKLPTQASSSTNSFPSTEASAQVVEAPTFHPSEEEFSDPLEYIEQIRPLAEQYGLCRIVPPPTFKPECKVADDMRFTAYNQYVQRMLHRWGPSSKESAAIRKHLATENITLKQPPCIGGVELDLPQLYHKVQSCGGLRKVIEQDRWQRVADAMKIPKSAHDRATKLDEIYCKYLLPYDTLSSAERSKLFSDVEKEWKHHKFSENELFEDVDECIIKGRSMALSQFYRVARNVMTMHFGGAAAEKEVGPDPEEVESEYWEHVSSGQSHVCVHSASIDTGPRGYGFPTTKNSTFAKHSWNLKVLTNNTGSVLRSMGPIIGVTVPTLHVGMLYTTCCWYRDPHGLPWIEYLHTGASKIWYGIPAECNSVFRSAMSKLLPSHKRSDQGVWLASDTTMIPPPLLVENGVSLSRIIQQPGQFIVVFPRAFTSSIATGYLLSESVYFAPSTWLQSANDIFKDLQNSCESSIFSLEQLLCCIATDSRTSLDILIQVAPLVSEMRDREVALRSQLEDLGLRASERLPRRRKSQVDEEEDYECEVCHANLYISLVLNSFEESVYCLSHGIELLSKKRNHLKYCKLQYSYTEEELEEMIVKLHERIDQKSQKKPLSRSSNLSNK